VRDKESVPPARKEHQQEIVAVLSPYNQQANTYKLESDATYGFAIELSYASVYGPNSSQDRLSVGKSLYEEASVGFASFAERDNRQIHDHKGKSPLE
jgi:hypothetical protein